MEKISYHKIIVQNGFNIAQGLILILKSSSRLYDLKDE